MKKDWYIMVVLLLASCSSDNEREPAIIYTGSRMNVEAAVSYVHELFFDENYLRMADYSMSEDTTFVLSHMRTYRDSLVLSISGTNAQLQVERTIIEATTSRIAETYKLALDGKHLTMHQWKGEPLVTTTDYKELYRAIGHVDGLTLTLTSNDTTYSVQGVGNQEVNLIMVAPVHNNITTMKRHE